MMMESEFMHPKININMADNDADIDDIEAIMTIIELWTNRSNNIL